MINVLVSLLACAAGAFAVWRIYLAERALGGVVALFATTYFAAQHIAYSFSALLIALFDTEASYFNDHGTFLYRDGMVRWQVVNVCSIFAAWGAAELIRALRAKRHPAPVPNPERIDPLRICYITLGAHALIVTLQWSFGYMTPPGAVRYVVNMLSPITLAAFYFWGLWWKQPLHARLVFLAYVAFYGIVQMASGNRGTFISAFFLFFWGYFLNRKHHATKFSYAVGAGLVVLLLVAISISENVRIAYAGRVPRNWDEWKARTADLFRGTRADEEHHDPFVKTAVVKAAATIIQYSPFDIVVRTPTEVPYRRWSGFDTTLLVRGLLPELEVTEQETAYTSAQMAAAEYGWRSTPGAGHAMPITLLADAWRRAGYVGVILTHFLWALGLVVLTGFSARRAWRKYHVILSGALVAIVYHLYVWDILGLLSPLPRRAIACLLYAALVYFVLALVERLLGPAAAPTLPRSGPWPQRSAQHDAR